MNPTRSVTSRFSLVADWTLKRSEDSPTPSSPHSFTLGTGPLVVAGGENETTCDSRCSSVSPAARLSHHKERTEIRLAGTNERVESHSKTLSDTVSKTSEISTNFDSLVGILPKKAFSCPATYPVEIVPLQNPCAHFFTIFYIFKLTDLPHLMVRVLPTRHVS